MKNIDEISESQPCRNQMPRQSKLGVTLALQQILECGYNKLAHREKDRFPHLLGKKVKLIEFLSEVLEDDLILKGSSGFH